MKALSHRLFPVLAGLLLWYNAQAQLPEGFEYTLLTDQLFGNITVDFAENGLVYVADFYGRIWLIEDNVVQPDPVLDISPEVGGYGELGCLGFALHPDFMMNGYFYMLYVVDRHHLLHFGTDQYDPEANEYNQATMGRLTRFQVQLSDYRTIVPGSRTVLFGNAIGEGNPVVAPSHGTGDIVFGSDGSLMFSTGDGNTWVSYFAGGDQELPAYAMDDQGLEDGILSPEENVGSFRAQMLESYNGKVLRIDPMTGEGLPSNPFFDPENPDGARSKVWALGLRNPYRMTLRPGTGSENPEDGDPGTLYITDVGYNEWEEINICDGAGYNFGWPLYEGLEKQFGFYNKTRKNFHQPNPYQTQGCSADFFTFQQLLLQENGQHDYFYPNPCNSASNMANYADVFYHTRPAFTYRNTAQAGEMPLIPGFNESGEAIGIEITSPELGIEQAEYFDGIAAMAGDFYAGESFPEEYHNILPVLDYNGWLKVFWFDENHELTKMEHWMDGLQNVVDMRYNPIDECYYAIGMFPSQIHQLCFAGNLRPVVIATATPHYGTSPLLVEFDASETYDPEGDPLTFLWDFGDGGFSSDVITQHEYVAPSNDPFSFNALLTVSDTAGNVVERDFLISLNNSPPQVTITSIADSTLYTMTEPTAYALVADVFDAEHTTSELTFEWNTFLHHNTHFHALNSSSDVTSNFVIYPVGCGDIDSYHFRVSLRVTDPEGLEGYDEVYLYPDCDGVLGIDSGSYYNQMRIYPNPASDQAIIDFGLLDNDERVTLNIYDITGNMLFEKTYILERANAKVAVSFGDFSSGQYIIKAQNERINYTGRIMVIRH